MRFVGAHPHKGETGTVRDDLPMLRGMWKIDLDGSTGACYASADDLRYLAPEEDPYA